MGTKTYGTPIDDGVHQRPAGHRNRVGEADPATRRRILDQRLNEHEPVRPARAKPSMIEDEPAAGVSPNTMRILKTRGQVLDKEIDKRS